MRKIIICDKNKELINALKKIDFSNKEHVNIEISDCDDVIDLHKETPNSRIVTASNPDFNPGGGLDALLAKKYDWNNAKEFSWNNDLFWVVSVDDKIQTNEQIIQRALAGVFAYSYEFTMILTGIGTGIGGLDIKNFVGPITNLSSANLRSADLRSANLSSANLSSADLSFADLISADLSFADLSSANLSFADLSSANLSFADLSFADLSSANLSSADLSLAKNLDTVAYNENTSFFALQCPEEGSFIGWKRAGGCIIKLQITENAKRSSATTRKCRCSEAKVLAIYKGDKKIKEVASNYDKDVIYRVDEIVKPKEKFNENRWIECTSGIHFFITRKEAEVYG